MNEIQKQVWETVKKLNQCWSAGDPDDLKEYFHERMVVFTPSDQKRLEGGQTCVASWKEFAELVEIVSWNETDPNIQIYGDTAVVTYYYELIGRMNDKPAEMCGRDMMTLVKENGRWWLVADQFSPYPVGQQSAKSD
ncbi:MAG: nuclear transport factor 2 family protein [candidate division Zixibacteria bacterium]|nr:nuclear transport factor 2 family protein [candidate division Zixibacteria bacterium]